MDYLRSSILTQHIDRRVHYEGNSVKFVYGYPLCFTKIYHTPISCVIRGSAAGKVKNFNANRTKPHKKPVVPAALVISNLYQTQKCYKNPPIFKKNAKIWKGYSVLAQAGWSEAYHPPLKAYHPPLKTDHPAAVHSGYTSRWVIHFFHCSYVFHNVTWRRQQKECRNVMSRILTSWRRLMPGPNVTEKLQTFT